MLKSNKIVADNTMETVILRKVQKGKQISREEGTIVQNLISNFQAKDLWKQGKLTGLFNIPFESEEIFNQCQDFCIEQEINYGTLQT